MAATCNVAAVCTRKAVRVHQHQELLPTLTRMCCRRRAGAFYLRLVGKAVDVYQYLEPLYNDYRKVRFRDKDGSFVLSHIDEVRGAEGLGGGGVEWAGRGGGVGQQGGEKTWAVVPECCCA